MIMEAKKTVTKTKIKNMEMARITSKKVKKKGKKEYD